MSHGENCTPFNDVKLILALPGANAIAVPSWLTYITARLLEVQVPFMPAKLVFNIGLATPSL